MFTFLSIVHIIVSFIMIIFILLQDPKGGGAFGIIGGGGTKSLFGSSGANQFLVGVTKWTAIIFAFTSIYLAALSSDKNTSVIDQYTNAPETTDSTSSNSAPADAKVKSNTAEDTKPSNQNTPDVETSKIKNTAPDNMNKTNVPNTNENSTNQ